MDHFDIVMDPRLEIWTLVPPALSFIGLAASKSLARKTLGEPGVSRVSVILPTGLVAFDFGVSESSYPVARDEVNGLVPVSTASMRSMKDSSMEVIFLSSRKDKSKQQVRATQKAPMISTKQNSRRFRFHSALYA